MTTSESLKLPRPWQFEETAGGVDVRVASPGRRYLTAGLVFLAIVSGARTIADWNHGSSTSTVPWLLLMLCLVLLALWCAFADSVATREELCNPSNWHRRVVSLHSLSER